MTDLEEQIRKTQEHLYSVMVEGSQHERVPLTEQPIYPQHGIMKISREVMLRELETLIKEFQLVQEQMKRVYEFELIGTRIIGYQDLKNELSKLI